MEKIEQTYLDRSSWTTGIWDNDPDRISWTDEKTGYDCLMRRQPNIGFWCGYVAIEKNHSLFGKHYDEIGVIVHGDLSYSESCDGDIDQGICHLKKDGDHAWWLGFDCAHGWDTSPSRYLKGYADGYGKVTYKDINYVTAEVESLAKQLRSMEKIDN